MAEDTKVSIELVADDKASQSLEKITKKLEEMGQAREKAEGKKEGGEKFSWEEAFKIEAVKEFAEKLHEIVGEWVKAGAEQDKVIRSITGVLAMTDQTGQSYDSLLAKGSLFEEELHNTAIEAGVAQDKIVAAFNMIMERAGKSAEETNELTRKMAFAAQAVPGGMEAMASGFAMMESGMVRARNPVVQMISSMGLLKGNAMAVAHQLQQMGSDERSRIAVEAITKMSEKMEAAAPSFESVMTSLHEIKEGVIEDVGHSLLKSLVPKLAEFTKSVLAWKDQLTFSATEVGEFLGGEFDKIWADAKEAWHTITSNSVEIGDTLKDAADGLTDAFGQALKWSADIASIIGGGAQMIETSLKHQKAFFEEMIESGKRAIGLPGAKAAGEPTHEMFQHEMQAAVKSSKMYERELFGGRAEAGAAYAHLYSMHGEAAEAMGMGDVLSHGGIATHAQERFKIAQQTSGVQFSEAQKNMAMSTVEESKVDAAQQFADSWGKAAAMQDEEQRGMLEDWGAMMLLKNQDFAGALAAVGDKAKIDWEAIFHQMQNIVQMGGATKEEMEAVKKMVRTGPGTKGAGPTFNIGHMTINQDFRDQDPDRVAIIFQKDLAKAAMNRTQAMLTGPFSP